MHFLNDSALRTMTENIVWSAESCSLKTFLERYTLPQLVKVEDGFYSEDDAETLSTGEILMLHSVTRQLVVDADYRKYFVSRNCQCKVEVLPTICQDRYYSVEDVVDACTYADFKFIRVVEVHSHSPSLRIRAGDILKLQRTVEQNHIKFLECMLNDRTEYLVKLPLDVKAVFEPLARKESYPFQEVIHSFEFPVRVKFKSNCKSRDTNNNQSRGSVLLKNIRRESKIIATSRDDAMNPVLMIPTDLDVYVFPARGANLGDKEYARCCKAVYDSIELSKVDLFENASRLCECFEDPAEREIENNDVVNLHPSLLPSQTIQDTQRLSIPKPTNPKQASASLSSMLIRNGGHVFSTSNDNPPNTLNDQAPPRPLRVESPPCSVPPLPPKSPKQASSPSAKLNQSPHQGVLGEDLSTTLNQNPSSSTDDQAPPRPLRVESLPWSVPPLPPQSPKQASSPSAKLNQSPHQGVLGEDLSTTLNQNPSSSTDDQAPPRPLRVESLLHANATGADKDDDYHHYAEISSTGRNLNLALSVEHFHMDNDSESVLKRHTDKRDQSKSSERNSLSTVIPKLATTLTGNLQYESSDAVVSTQRSHLIRPSSKASSSVCSSDAAFSSQKSTTQGGSIPEQLGLPTQSLVLSYLERSQDYAAENVYIDPVTAPSILSNSPSEFSVFSKDLKDLPVEGVVECLTNLHMGQYAEIFQRNLIDGQLLMELDLESLSHLGVRNPLHKKKLLKFINGWRPNTR